MTKPCGLVCMYVLRTRTRSLSCAPSPPSPSSSLCSPPRLSSRLCCLTEFHRSSAKMTLLGSERRGC